MPFSRLLKYQTAQQSLAWWKQVFGPDFPAVHRFLIPLTGKRVGFYPCPDDPDVQLTVRESGEKYRAFPTGEYADDFDDLELNWDDVQAHGFNTQGFIDFVRDGFGVKKRLFQPLENLNPVGHCPVGDRSVYASLHTDSAKNLAIAADIHGPETAGCVVFPERVDHAEALLHGKGIAAIFLDEAYSSTKLECRQCCRKLEKDITNLELQQNLVSRIDSVGREFADMEAENERLKGDLAKVIAQIASQVDPEYFKWIYMVLASGSVRKAADALDIPSSTFDRQLKDRADSGGSMYKTLFGLISVRRKCGTKSVEGYNPDFALHQQAALSDSSVISDLLGGLRSLNATNWQTVQQELVELVEEEFGTLSGN
ncbi:MAG: hypothetical protein WC829_23705 [Hyphomicrobium sp.]|jgi:hypothetical protein